MAELPSDFVILEDFYEKTDSDDYGPALTRASIFCAANGRALHITKMYQIKTRPTLSSNTTLIGEGKSTGFFCTVNTPITMLYASGATNISIYNLYLNGGITTSTSVKDYTRGVRWLTCSDVIMDNCWSSNCSDWAISFERCDRVQVRNHIHFNGGLGNPGGRDGLHFLDTSFITVRNAHIDSGDDCIGVTVETRICTDIDIEGVVGRSDIASIITIADEKNSTGGISNVRIRNVKALNSADCRYIIQANMPNGSFLNAVLIDGVSGKSRSHSIYANSVNDLTIINAHTESKLEHGIYVVKCKNFHFINICSKSNTKGYHGHCFSYVERITGNNIFSEGSATFGLEILNSNDVYISNAILINNGLLSFPEAGGANLRVSKCTNVTIDGDLSGDNTITYRGVSQADNTRFIIKPGTLIGGLHSFNNRLVNDTFDAPYAITRFSQNSNGSLSTLYNKNVTLLTSNGLGDVTITLNDSLRSGYSTFITANESGQLIPYAIVRSQTSPTDGTPSKININMVDLKNSAAPCGGIFSILVYESN